MENSLRPFATSHHNRMAEALRPLKGKIIDIKEARTAILALFPELGSQENWILLSDHSSNMMNKGACICAKSKAAIVENVEKGRYLVL